MKCRYLDGDAAPFRTAAQRKALVGKRIEYLRDCDIDRSGRGYFFPRIGIVESASGVALYLDNGSDLRRSDIVELRVLGERGAP